MALTIDCPECGKSLRIPDEKAGTMVKCPKCSARFRAEAADEPEDEFPAIPKARSKTTKKKSSSSGSLQPFLTRWFIAVGIVLALTLILGIAGLSSEVLAITACMICIVAILGCLIAGTIWMVIDLAKENGKDALLAALMPPMGLVMSFQKKGPARRGAIVFVSMLAPLLLLGVMLLFFLPKYTGPGRRAAQTGNWKSLMQQLDSKASPDTPIVTVTIKVASNPGALAGLEPRCEELLRPYKCYVSGSLKIDENARTITYQYRGDATFNQMIAFYLSSSTGAFTPQGIATPAGP